MMFMTENNMLVEDALTRVQSILDIEPLPENGTDSKVSDYSIELKNATFRYEGAQRDAVSGISLKIPQGSMSHSSDHRVEARVPRRRLSQDSLT